MALNLVNQVGEWNPQLFREIKGRLKPRNILIAVTLSLLAQLLVLMSFSAQLPIVERVANAGPNGMSNRYCTGNKPYPYSSPNCILDSFGGVEINWQLWWQDVFMGLSIAGVVILLIVGTYMLINDISKEEQRSTLNFLRLTPQSSQSILIGKMLGVPILLYLIGFLAFPLHLAAGLSGEISFGLMLGWYALVGAACLFFYSAALLFGLIETGMRGGFKAWLGSGALLIFVWIMTVATGSSNFATQSPTDWIIVFNPSAWLTYLTGTNSINGDPSYASEGLTKLVVWGLPVGKSALSMLGVMLLNFAIWTYWAWVGLKRCFHNPKATLFGKQQSYWLTACFQVVILGFAVSPKVEQWRSLPKGMFDNFQMLMVFNLLLFLSLMAALSPQRQAMQDWARYRHQNRSSRKGGVMADLIWGEKSPALVAVALNLAIASSILLTWVLFWPSGEYKLPAVFALLVSMSLTLVYAAVAQLILLMKSQKRASLAAGAVGLLILVPQLMIAFLSEGGNFGSDLWLFSAFPWVAVKESSAMTVFLAVIVQSLATGLLSLQLTRKLRKAGESSTKALLSGRSPVAAD